MKRSLKVISISLCIVLLAGCAANLNLRTYDFQPPPLESFIDQAIWSNATKDKVYTSCVTALHLQDFGVHPMGTSKESGLIVVRQTKIDKATGGYVQSSYSLQILVYELPDNKVMVDVNPKGLYQTRNLPDTLTYNKSYELLFKNKINNKVAADMKIFFTQMDTLLGKAEYHRGGIFLKWE